MGTTELERWTVRVTSSHRSVVFASIGWAELRGLWLVRLMPNGPGLDCLTTFADYASREVAHMREGNLADLRRHCQDKCFGY
jgi:hypothetical protein